MNSKSQDSPSPTMNQPANASEKTAIVIGAGPAGLSLGLGLSRRGWKVILIEKRESFEVRGASFGIAPNGIKALTELHPGVVPRLQQDGIQLPSGGLLIPWWMMRDALLAQVNYDQDEENAPGNIEVRMGLSVVEILDEDGGEVVVAKFSNGTMIEGNIIVGADGVHSAVRNLLGLIPHEFTGGKVFRGTINVFDAKCSKIDEELSSEISTAPLQGLLSKGMVPISVTTPGMHFFVLSFHPTKKGRLCWVLGTNDPDYHPNNMSLLSFMKEKLQQLKGETEDNKERNIIIRSILEASPEHSLTSFTETKVADFSDEILLPFDGRWGGKGKVTIIGDAAHAMRPTNGQGGNMAFEDAIVLCRLLDIYGEHSETKRVDEILEEFEKERLPRIKKIHDDQRMRYDARMRGEDIPPWSSEFKEWVNNGI